MRLNENIQERLEAYWIASEENGFLDPDLSGVQAETDRELQQMGLLEDHRLTAAGKKEAALAIRRHRLAERLFADVLVTEENLVDERACSLEHALFDGIDESICTLLGHPKFCPHGKPIPPGKCCESMRGQISPLIQPLRDLEPGQEGRIAYVQMKDPQHLQKLMAMGVLPGVSVRVQRRFPSYVFEAGYSQFAVDEAIAGDIYVRVNQ